MFKIHPLADVQSINIGEGTIIWQFSVILSGAKIGQYCNINCHTFIENEVVIGDHVTIKSGIYLWDGIIIKDNVFLGPNVVFTNDLRPRSKQRVKFTQTIVKKGASLGANSSILAGVTIGEYAMIGMGAVVTKDVPNYALVHGNPARMMGWVDEDGKKLKSLNDRDWISGKGERFVHDQFGNLTKV